MRTYQSRNHAIYKRLFPIICSHPFGPRLCFNRLIVEICFLFPFLLPTQGFISLPYSRRPGLFRRVLFLLTPICFLSFAETLFKNLRYSCRFDYNILYFMPLLKIITSSKFLRAFTLEQIRSIAITESTEMAL